MKCIMVMYDSLNRRMLEPYGSDWTQTPNFRRLAERTVRFDNSFVGSMPCMPARRELHTGRYNFLHRSWGPIEPFDDSMPEILKTNGVHSHLASDHYHYWEEGGMNYHTRYRTWEMSRGQEGDPWKGEVKPAEKPDHIVAERPGPWPAQDWINRKYMDTVEKQSQHVTFSMGLEFMRTNVAEDNWFLQIETFDPHEPYFTHQRFKDLYPHDYDGGHFDWPPYRMVEETPEEVQHCRYESAALHSMCDEQLGRVLDLMDELDLWQDTMLIVNTDHGFLLGEHDWWAKCAQPFYNEIAHTPLFIWDPRSSKQGETRESMVQTIDLAPTILELFGLDRPADMQGLPLRQTVADDTPVREAGLYGMFGAHVNVTDGRYVYMRAPIAPDNKPLFEYTLMPTNMHHTFAPEQFNGTELADAFSFTKGVRPMKIAARPWGSGHRFGTMLFDLKADPKQEHPIEDAEVEARMVALMVRLMKENDAPTEQFQRLGLEV